jgi:hypothetical protein
MVPAPRRRAAIRHTSIAALALFLLVFLAACTRWPGLDGSSRPDPADSAGNVEARYLYPSGGALKCTSSGLVWRWRFIPIKMTGQVGVDHEVVQEKKYDEPANVATKECRFTAGGIGFRRGEWEVRFNVIGPGVAKSGHCRFVLEAQSVVVTMQEDIEAGVVCSQFPPA